MIIKAHSKSYGKLIINTNLLSTLPRKNYGFTIVELLVVIVVIGVLATISVVAYSGVTKKAAEASLQADLSNASKTLKMYEATHGSYPTEFDENYCPSAPVIDNDLCLKASDDNSYENYSSDGSTFTLESISANNIKYTISGSTSPEPAPELAPTLADTDPDNWIAVGTQVWAKTNLNFGNRISGSVNQTNNSVNEKYCYNNLESNCTTYGALYQWGEATQYGTTPNNRGLCPVGSHIPSDDEWKTLEMFLGMTQAQADATGFRGTNQATQMKPGGTAGLNIPLAGYRLTGGTFSNLSSSADLWTSTESGTNAYNRYLHSSAGMVFRDVFSKAHGFAVRCIGD